MLLPAFHILSIFQVHIGPTDKPISKFFAKKSIAYGQSGKHETMSRELAGTLAYGAAKAECDESVQNQPEDVNQQQSREKQTTNSTVKDEPVTLEPQVFEKPWSIKHEDTMTLTDATMKKQGDLGFKRTIKDIEVEADMKPCQPTKKEKAVKAACQASLLSYFARK
jgi:hypothetical protein